MTRTTLFSAALIGMLALTGCANKRQQQRMAQTQAPIYAPRADSQVYYQRTYQDGAAPPADLAWGDVYVDNQSYAQPYGTYPTEMVGYETMTTGEQVVVVTYVHTYVDPIETYPRVYWAGRWYYNVGGTFVFWDPFWGSWVYYWGPPAPLVLAWNYHYPWVGYCWGTGYYGPGWYWGGVGYYGWHAYGRPPADWRPSHGPNGDPGGPTGHRPEHGPNDPGPGRTGIDSAGSDTIGAPPTSGGADLPARDIAPPTKPDRSTGGSTPTVAAGGTDVTAPTKPGRAPLSPKSNVGASDIAASKPPRSMSDSNPQRIQPSQPPRAPVAASTTAARADLTPRQTPARARVPSVVQVHDAAGGATRPSYAPPTARRAPTATVANRAPTRVPTTVGTNPNPRTPTRMTSPSSTGPTYRTVTPHRSPTTVSTPSYSPSRSSSPSSYSPSRASSPSYTPSRSYSPSSHYSPSRSSGSSYSPSRSSGSSYSPGRSHSGGSSFSPGRSHSGGSSFSPGRSSGGGGGFSPGRSSGGGGGHHAPSRSR